VGGVARHIGQPLLECKRSAEVENTHYEDDQQRQRHSEFHQLGGVLVTSQISQTAQMESAHYGFSMRTCADAFK
jgi:hypothetical protein